MMLKREAPHKPSKATPWLRSIGAGVLATAASLALAAGCLQRPVQPQDPNTSNLFVDQIVQTAVDKIDLLFMIDNSRSMADKQRILSDAVPVLVQRLVTPACVDRDGNATGQNVTNGRCPGGSEPEFAAIRDIHIGIVTSSLGDMGSGDACTPGAAILDDKGQMLGTPGLRTAPLSNWNGQGFLAWDPDAAMGRARNMPAGTTDANTLITDFTDMVVAAGEQGCGYEASLEAWYRFLIDPEPPGTVTKMEVSPGNELTVAGPADPTILAQRAAFLRPDSLVAIVMLTDENDCSIIDYGQGWIVGLQQGGQFYMPRATSACGTNPNDPCCFSCSLNAANVPANCTQPASDQECIKGQLSMAEDHPNLRCFQQKRRFGFDLLHPVGKYIQGLTQPSIYNPRKGDINGDGKFFQPDDTVPNPLFETRDGKRRDRSLVFLAGIVGVPWQDISDQASWTDARRLKYLSYTELVAEGRWDWILGASGGPPQDGLMFETDKDRTGFSNVPQAHPGGAAVGGSIVASTSTQQLANPINGHESSITDGSDLQFSCIFPLNQELNCDTTEVCDCKSDDEMYNRALCRGHTQTHAKAFPGTRHLEVLKGVGEITGNAIVASICPKNSTAQGSASSDANYGYNPAVAAIIDRLKDALKGKCLPRTLTTNEEGKIPCVVVEARPPEANGCSACGGPTTPNRTEASENIKPVVRDKLADSGFCGKNTGTDCNSYCLCQVEQYQGADLASCQTGPAEPVDPKGYCYVDGSPGPGEDPNSQNVAARKAIVAKCPASQQRLLRFATEVPAKGAVAFIACIGDSLSRPTATMVP